MLLRSIVLIFKSHEVRKFIMESNYISLRRHIRNWFPRQQSSKKNYDVKRYRFENSNRPDELGSGPVISSPLSTAALRLLKEYGLRYGVVRHNRINVLSIMVLTVSDLWNYVQKWCMESATT